ncbi:MAG: zf-HC2 domain-containing protein [Pseudomonadota bacterium]
MTNPQQHPEELLPWYVNGSLPEHEMREIDAHLAQCPVCEREAALLRAMRDEARENAGDVPAEFAWQRLRRDLHRNDDRAGVKRSWWAPSLAAAAVLTIAIQSVMLYTMTERDDGYGLAGDRVQSATLQVKFNPDATEKELRGALQAAGAEIVTGPSAMGVYRIRLVKADGPVQERITDLQSRHDVFDYVQQE